MIQLELFTEYNEVIRDLTPREISLIKCLGRGMLDKEIAYTLKLAPGTIKTYNSKLFDKIGVTNRVQLAIWGRENL